MQDRRSVVTGAFGQLGSTVARAFARAGAKVALLDVAPTIPPVLEAEFGQSHLLIRAVDLADVEATRKAMAAAAMRFGGIDVLVNVAGGFRYETLLEGGVATWDEMFAMNLRTAVVSCKAALPALLESGRGRIINIGAGAAAKGRTGMGAYTASKAGVQRLTESLADELKDRGVTVNAILPGTIDTPILADITPEMREANANSHLIKRLGRPEEIAGMMAYCFSGDGDFTTGLTFPVDGGWSVSDSGPGGGGG